MKTVFIKFIIIFLILTASGCGKNNEKKIGDLKGNNTMEEIDGIKLPGDYPSEFHVPQGSKVLSVNIGKDGTNVMFQSEETQDKLIADYKKSASDAGYEEQFASNSNNYNKGEAMVFLRQKDKKNVTINITQNKKGDKSIILFIYKSN